MRISGHEFARMCDATLTGAVATHQEMLEMIKQAKKYHFLFCYRSALLFG